MRRTLVVLCAACLLGGAALTSALASSFNDPAGDATGSAPDVTAVNVTNDNGGQILFDLAVTNFTPESMVMVMLDTDKNQTTGSMGADYALMWMQSASGSGWDFARWNGQSFVDTPYATVRSALTAAGVQFSVNKSEIGDVSGLALKVMAARFTADAVTGMDMAPDGVSYWTYDLTAPPAPTPTPTPAPAPTPAPKVVKPVFGAATITPKAKAGAHVLFTLKVNRSDNGQPLTTGKMICDPSVKAVVIKHAESFKGGVATLGFTIPKSAKGKILKVKVTIVNGNQTATKVTSYKVL